MNAWEEKILERQEAREEGFAEGRAEGLEQGLEQGLVQGLEQGRSEARQKTEAVLKNLFRKGFSAEDAAAITETELEQVQKLFKSFTEN